MGKNETLPDLPGYKLERKLGRGGMADVYLGVQEVLGRKVAIKILSPRMFGNRQVVQRFLNEARTACRLAHPNIVTIHDVGQVENTCYIVMEYLPEGLIDRIKSSPGHKLPPKEAFQILVRMTKALEYAHREGFIHRDIKPDNILFRKDGTPVLVDFGIARAVDADSHLTTTGMIIGTPHYMSPEQCRGEKADAQSDIYSLGIVLYEMLTGDIPYRADSAAGVLVKHLQDPIPLLSPELGRYQALLNRMMAKDKSQRLHTGAELLELLQRLAPKTPLDTIEASRPEKWVFDGDEDTAAEEPTTISPYKPPAKRKSLAWLLLILLVIVGAGAAYYYFAYLPALQKKSSSLPQSPGEKEVTVHEPGIATPGKQTQPVTPGGQTGPADQNAGGEIRNSEYIKYMSQAEVYFKEGKIKETREKVDQARAIADTPEVRALQKQIDDYLDRQKQVEFDRYFSLANEFYKKGNYAKARENLDLAQQVKTTAELDTLAENLREKEAAAQKKAEQERLQKKRDDDAYRDTVARNTIYAYEKYLEKYPNGLHVAEAQKRLGELKDSRVLENKIQDDVAFQMASEKNTLSDLESYLKQFPLGLHAAEAKAAIEKLKAKIVKETEIKIELQHIKFFESGAKPLPVEQRSFNTRFAGESTRYIYTEVKYKNLLYGIADSSSRILLEYSGTGGFGSNQLKGMLKSSTESQDALYCQGMGWPDAGKWLIGKYTVTVFVDDKKIGQSQFEIY